MGLPQHTDCCNILTNERDIMFDTYKTLERLNIFYKNNQFTQWLICVLLVYIPDVK